MEKITNLSQINKLYSLNFEERDLKR